MSSRKDEPIEANGRIGNDVSVSGLPRCLDDGSSSQVTFHTFLKQTRLSRRRIIES